MEAALKSVLAWWDESGVDVPKIAPVKAGGRRAAARASDTGQAAYKPPPPQSSAAKRAPRPASQTAPQTASQTAQQTPPEAAPLALIAEAEKQPPGRQRTRPANPLPGRRGRFLIKCSPLLALPKTTFTSPMW